MSAPAAHRADLLADLALSLLLAGVAFWAGAEWFRELHRDALDDLAGDFEDVVGRAVDAHMAARDADPRPEPAPGPPVGLTPDELRVAREEIAQDAAARRRAKFPRQSEPTE